MLDINKPVQILNRNNIWSPAEIIASRNYHYLVIEDSSDLCFWIDNNGKTLGSGKRTLVRNTPEKEYIYIWRDVHEGVIEITQNELDVPKHIRAVNGHQKVEVTC